ncbi:MAG: phenylalanine--tRNA ligase subunit alpha [Candidatus Acidiferrales bacterium]
MTTDPTTQTLAQLGDTTPEQIAARFERMRERFDKECADLSATGVGGIDRFEALRLSWTGRKSGGLTRIGDNWLKPAPSELKRIVGQEFQKLKVYVEKSLEDDLNSWRESVDLGLGPKTDLSLPGVERTIGTRHLIRQTYEDLQRIFLSIGFSVVEGPEIETPYYNFEALNIPEHHPARDNMDTFYIEGARGGHLLRTHTSPMQIRTMERQPPPVRIIVPGKVYRRDNPDATHGYMFHQIEGLAVDTDITFCDFKGTVEYFVREFFGPKAKTRLRPSYFPFTEPSAEVDATCHVCGGKGCRVCKFSGWIELFGAGMVNPAVYGFVKNGYDAAQHSGFAFGMGVDRLAMMKYGVTELPLLYQNDVRFLRQFP